MRTNVIYRGDCERVLGRIPEGSVDLIYADPPFFTNRNYEQIWKNPDGSPDEYEVRSFRDRWAGGVENFISWMEPRLRECHRVLKDTGTMYLHCDWHANAHLRILMDRIFGERNFGNEIIWCYAGGGIPKYDFPRKHDTILRYRKGAECIFNTEYRPYGEWTKAHTPRHSLTSGGEPLDMTRGTPVNDWWSDMKHLTSYQQEHLGYPTQKPEALLDRIIRVSSNPGDIVLDPFCGCGTAIAVAQKLGRRWIGIDVSPNACRVMKARLDTLLAVAGESVALVGMPRTLADVRALTHYEFQQWALEALHAIPSAKYSGDMGIDGRTVHGDVAVQVKQSDHVGRNVVDNFKAALDRDGKRSGIIVALSFGRGAREEVARLRNLPNGQRRDIELRSAEDLLRED